MRTLTKTSLAPMCAAHKDSDSRYAINCLKLEADNSLTATNGHILARTTKPSVEDDIPEIEGFQPEKDPHDLFIPLSLARRVMRDIPASRTLPVLNQAVMGRVCDTERPALAVTDLDDSVVWPLKTTARNFPDWNVVLPKDEPESSCCLSIAVLEVLVKTLKQFHEGGPDHAGIRLEVRGEDTQVVGRAHNNRGEDLLIVAMPVKL